MPRKWTIELFRELGADAHPGKYNYDNTYLVSTAKNKIAMKIKCNTCLEEFDQRVPEHIDRGHGCPVCYKNSLYTYEKFIEDATAKHGDKYDYSTVDKSIKFSGNPSVTILCKECNRIFKQKIEAHVYRESGCKICNRNQYTYEKFTKKAVEIHGDKFNYSLLDKSKVYLTTDKVDIICNKCTKTFDQPVNAHIHGKKGCRYCANNVPYTYEKFMEKVEANKVRYDYSLVDPNGSFKMTDDVLIKCKKCNKQFWKRIVSHIHGKSGCPKCCRSHGEIAVENYLNSRKCTYEIEYSLPSLPRRRYDAAIHDKKIMIEFDGGQHFDISSTFHRDEEEFIEDQHTDVIKSAEAIKCGYKIIRIGYNIKDMEKFLDEAMNSSEDLYVSDPNLYIDHVINVLELLPNITTNLD